MGRVVLAGFPLLDVKVKTYLMVHSMRWIHLAMACWKLRRWRFPSTIPESGVHNTWTYHEVDVFCPDDNAVMLRLTWNLSSRPWLNHKMLAQLACVLKVKFATERNVSVTSVLCRTMDFWRRGQFSMGIPALLTSCPRNVAEEVIKETKEREAAAKE